MSEETESQYRARLDESESRFRVMADTAPVLLWMAGKDGECDFFNQVWLDFTGRPLERELGAGWAEGVHAEDFQRCMHVYMSSFVERRPFRMEYRLRRADGQYRWVLDTGAPRRAQDGSFLGYVGSCVDITELKELQISLDDRVRERTSKLQSALAARETLLHEVHHRLKNNLQVISSILGLQARRMRDAESSAAFAECQSRVASIGRAHERLRGSKDFDEIELAAYAKGIAQDVSCGFGGADGRVGIEVQIPRTMVSIDQAIPCGLILNELLTNAFKYAFPDGRKGHVVVVLHRSDESTILEVNDDGVGFPSDLDLKNAKSLGLVLVNTLAAQLNGKLEMVRNALTIFRIRFPAAEFPASEHGKDAKGGTRTPTELPTET